MKVTLICMITSATKAFLARADLSGACCSQTSNTEMSGLSRSELRYVTGSADTNAASPLPKGGWSPL